MARKINEDNWLECVMNALEELDELYDIELVNNDIDDDTREVLEGKQEELKALITYLNKTD